MRPRIDWNPELDGDEDEATEASSGVSSKKPEAPPERPSFTSADTMRIDTEDAEPPRSRPTLSDSPKAIGGESGLDDDERAFFRAGDEGRYEGGPATLIPLAIDEEEADERPARTPIDPRVLHRRARNVRVVSLVVGMMGAIAAVALFKSAPSAAASTAVEAPRAAAAPPVVTAKPAPPPARADAPGKQIVIVDEPVPPAPEPTPVATAEAKTPAKPAAATPAPKKPARKTAAFVPAAAPEPELPRAPAAPATPAEPSGPPPTAAFPTP